MPYFTEFRNIELSTIYHLETQIDASWSGITTTKTFAQAYSKNIDLPIVCIRLLDIASDRLEIGATTLDNTYNIIIDIFATSDGQRIDLAHFITDVLKDSWAYNAYTKHATVTTQIVGTADGSKIQVVSFLENTKVEYDESMDRKDRHRHIISVSVKHY